MEITPEKIRALQEEERLRRAEETKRRAFEMNRHAWDTVKDVSRPFKSTLEKVASYALANPSESSMSLPPVPISGKDLNLEGFISTPRKSHPFSF